MGWTTVVRFPARRETSLRHRVQTNSGAQPASYQMGTGESFIGSKDTGAWSWPPLTSIFCRSYDCMELYLHSPIRLHGMVLKQWIRVYGEVLG